MCIFLFISKLFVICVCEHVCVNVQQSPLMTESKTIQIYIFLFQKHLYLSRYLHLCLYCQMMEFGLVIRFTGLS
jgi:hypothetical protein